LAGGGLRTGEGAKGRFFAAHIRITAVRRDIEERLRPQGLRESAAHQYGKSTNKDILVFHIDGAKIRIFALISTPAYSVILNTQAYSFLRLA
jgi:hypothetical protein